MYEKFKDFQLAILGLCIALGAIFAAIIVTGNLSNNNITVTGSAYEIVKSDSANWTFTITAKAPSRVQAYKIVQGQIPVVKKYLLAKGFTEDQIELTLSNSYETYKTNPNTGYTTSTVESYVYQQPVKITTKDVEKIKKLSTSYQELFEKGIINLYA